MTYKVYLCSRNQTTGVVSRTDITTSITTGFSLIEKLDNSLDVGTITIWGDTQFNPYDMFDWIEVEQEGTLVISQRVSGDSVKLISKNPLLYEHTLSLVEHTKILERYQVSGKTFTQPTDGTTRYYLYDVFEDLINSYPMETTTNLSTTRVCVLPTSGNLYDLLTTEESPEFTFKDLTLRECLNQVSDYVDGIVRLFINSSDELELTLDFVNELESLISSENIFIGKSIQQDIDLYATDLESEALNMVNDELTSESVEIYPSEGGYVSLRKDTFLQDGYDDNAYIPTPKRIYSVPKVVCRANISVINSVTSDTYYNGYTDIRITDRIVEKKEYDTLTFDGSDASVKYKTTTIYYEYRSKKVQHGITYGLWGISDVITNVLEVSIYNQGIEDGIIPSGTDIADLSISYITPTTIDDLIFQVHYVPIPEAMRTNIDRTDLSDVSYKSTILSNQQGRIVNLEHYVNNLQGKINRIGNDDLTLVFRGHLFEDLPLIGDYTDEMFIVTDRETIFYKDYIYCTLSLTKNFNKISSFIGINSEIRQWEIGENNTLDRNLIYKEYIEVDALTSGSGTDSSQLITSDGKETYLNTFNTSSTLLPVRGGMWVDDETYSPTCLVSLSSNGGGNNLIFNWKFQDNINVGFTRETVDGQIAKNYVPYTDEEGLNEDFTLYAIDGLSVPTTEAENLTRADKFPETNLTYRNNTLLQNKTRFKMYKDSREVIGGTIHLQQKSKDTSKLVLGRWLSLRNRLVSENPPSTIYLATYTNGTTYGRTDTFNVKGGFASYNVATITVSTTNNNIQITNAELTSDLDSYALVDETGKILLAVNQDGSRLDTITFDFLNKASGIKYKY